MAAPAATLDGWTVKTSCCAFPDVTTMLTGVTPAPFTVAAMDLVSATVDLNSEVKTPLAFVFPLDGVRELPDPLAFTVTAAPGTTFPAPSRAVTAMVTVDVALAGTDAGALMLDWDDDAPPVVMLKAALTTSV